MASSGGLSAESTKEQQSAGLLDISEEERQTMQHRNKMYKDKFGFPFVICVRENKKQAILSGMQERLGNSREEEVKKGVGEVKKIAFLRLCDIVKIDITSILWMEKGHASFGDILLMHEIGPKI